MSYPRSSGILLHPTSLPGRFPIGDLGSEAYEFVDFLSSSGQRYWQILPLGPTGFGDSPYQCFSAFAGNKLLISPDRLIEEGLVASRDVDIIHPENPDRVDFGQATRFKNSLMARAYETFRHSGHSSLRSEFESFCTRSADWLDDYALYRAIHDSNDRPWYEWERGLARREPDALRRAADELRDSVEARKFNQFIFHRQWESLKRYAGQRGIRLIGDIPIFVAYDSADVWTHPELFKLDKDFVPTVVAGVPPDYFSRTGQLWGNPLYNWDRIRETGYHWWIRRMQAALETVDLVRIDHFRGFAACWEVPRGEKTAEHGHWQHVPGHELFNTLKREFKDLPIIAEDLGVITPDVEALRDDFEFPGMRVLQFAFGGDSRNPHLPHNYVRNMVAYTGTHDNDTTAGWFKALKAGSAHSERERRFCLDYLRSSGEEINWDFIRAVFGSVAGTAIVPLQDVLGLDSSARMNLPATEEGNWNWRFRKEALTPEAGRKLREVTEIYGRLTC